MFMVAGLRRPEVVIVGIKYPSIDDVSRLQICGIGNVDNTVNFRCVAFRATYGAICPDLIDHHID